MNLLLFILSIILFNLFKWIGFIFALLTLNRKHLNNYFRAMAISIDQTGGVLMSALFNAILIEKDAIYKFGNPDWTISAVLGANMATMRLTNLGLWLAETVDKFDKTTDTHCLDAYEKEIRNETNKR